MTANPECDSIALYCDCLTDPADRQLVDRLRQGDSHAASVLYKRYARRLLARLDSDFTDAIRGEFDADRALQVAFRQALQRTVDGLYLVQATSDLWLILLAAALSNIRDHGLAADRDDAESTPASVERERDVVERAIQQMDFSEPDSLLRLVVAETLRPLPSFQRQCLEWRLHGLEISQIARGAGRTNRSVERNLQESRDKLREWMLENDNVLLS